MFTLDGDNELDTDDIIVINTEKHRTIAAFSLDMLTSLQMMQIQEVLQNIRNYYIHQDEKSPGFHSRGLLLYFF